MDDVVKNAILALADRHHGALTPEQVVQAARSPKSPLHPCFEWNQDRAADAFRLIQARVLIRSVRIEVTTTELVGPRRVPVFGVRPNSGAYATLDSLRQDPDQARESAIIEFARAASALKRARTIAVELGLGREAVNTITALIRNLETIGEEIPRHTE